MDIPILSYEQSLTDSQEYDVETKLESLDKKSTLDDSINECHSPCILPLNLTRLYSRTETVYKSARCNTEETLIDRSNMCVVHIKYYAYSCKTCQENMCSDCMSNPAKVFEKLFQHRGHRFEKYNQKKEELRLLMGEISAKLNFKKQSFSQTVAHIKNKYENSQSIHKEKEQKLQNHLERLTTLKEMREQVEQREEQLLQIKFKVREENNFYEECLQQLTESSKVKIISEFGSKIEARLNEHIQSVESIQHKFDKVEILPIHSPQPVEFIFHIRNFSEHKEEKKEVLLDAFHGFHNLWRLKVYPAGFTPQHQTKTQNNKPYLSIYIERLEGILHTTTFTIQIEIKSKLNPSLIINKEFQPEFTNSESWGYDKYTRLSNIYDHGFLGNDDTLTIKLKMSPISYQEAISTVSLVIQEKEKIKQKNIDRLTALRELLICKNKNKKEDFKSDFKEDTKMPIPNKLCLEEEEKTNQDSIKESQPDEFSQHERPEFIHNLDQDSQLKVQECKDFQPQHETEVFSTTIKREIKSKLDNEMFDLGIKKMQNIKYGQTFIGEHSPRRLIRLVSYKNAELAESCKKRVHNRSNTHD